MIRVSPALPFWLLSAASLGWLVAMVNDGMGSLNYLAELIGILGFGLAALGVRDAFEGSAGRMSLGLAGALLAQVLFYAANFADGEGSWYVAAIALYAIGVAGLLVVALWTMREADALAVRWNVMRGFAAFGFVAAALWVGLDGWSGGIWWQPGNVLALVGMLLLLLTARQRPHPRRPAGSGPRRSDGRALWGRTR